MSDFSTEPVVGHHVSAEVYRPDSPFSDVLDDVARSYGIPRQDTRRIRITRGDVNWQEKKTLSLDLETFEEIIEWYEEQK